MLHTSKRLPAAALLSTAFVLITMAVLRAPSVFAHAGYDHSTPGDGEVVATAPNTVDVFFLQQVARSGGLPTLVVVSDAGDTVSEEAVLDDDDRTHMSAALQDDLEDGRYTVIWHTLSADDDEEAEGAFHFYVGSGPTPIPSGGATTAPVDPGDEDDGDDGIPIWALIAGVAAGFFIGGGAGVVLGRRPNK